MARNDSKSFLYSFEFQFIYMSNFFQSKKFQIITWMIAGIIVLLLAFHAGVIVGYKKASFSYRWGENYHRNFGGPRSGFSNNFFDRDFIESHGTFGQIIKIDGMTLVVKGRGDAEKIIVIKNNTVTRKQRNTISTNDLKINDYIVIIGEPNNQGQIEAAFIRIMPDSFMPKQK